jgi:hypothetical protein
MEDKKDFLPIVRSVIKMSSALSDSDVVADSKYMKFKFKVLFKKWNEVYEVISKPFMGQFMDCSEEALQEAYNGFIEYSSGINLGDESRTSLVLFYCKMKSAMNDIENFPFEDGGFMVFALKKHTGNMIEALEKQYGDIFNIKDVDGNSIDAIVKSYDELGKTMFTK